MRKLRCTGVNYLALAHCLASTWGELGPGSVIPQSLVLIAMVYYFLVTLRNEQHKIQANSKCKTVWGSNTMKALRKS